MPVKETADNMDVEREGNYELGEGSLPTVLYVRFDILIPMAY